MLLLHSEVRGVLVVLAFGGLVPYEKLTADVARDLDDLRSQGRMSAATRLSTGSGQQFNAGTLPLYFTGDLEARLVLVHLNPKQRDSADRWSGGPVPGVEEYVADHASFGQRMYGPTSGRRHRSAFDHKQIRFLRPFGVIDFLDENQPDARFQNLERAIDQKLQMEVIPYGSDRFRRQGMTSELLAPHWDRLLDTIATHERSIVLFCGVVLGQLLQPYVTNEHRFRLPKADGSLTQNEARFANLRLEHEGRTLLAGLAYSYAQQGLPLGAYGAECSSRYFA